MLDSKAGESLAPGSTLSDGFYEDAKERLRLRLDDYRYRHSVSVSETAVGLAEAYGADQRKARIAGLLHDWDKCYWSDDIRARAEELGVEVDEEVSREMPQLLHGVTAAAALAEEFPGLDDDILQAIARHTTAAVDMSDLDMIVFIADVIEPLRPYGEMEDINMAIGRVPLNELFFLAFQQVLLTLVEKRKRVHPNSINVWNHYVSKTRKLKAGRE